MTINMLLTVLKYLSEKFALWKLNIYEVMYPFYELLMVSFVANIDKISLQSVELHNLLVNIEHFFW